MKKAVLGLTLMSSIFSVNPLLAKTKEVFDRNVFFHVSKDINHNIKILNSGIASFEERLQMIERAKESIEVEYFIYNADKSGKIFTQALIQKAKEGVKVRMLLDTFMIKSMITPFHVHELMKNGVEVKYFNNTYALSLVKGMYRNHRKLLIVDGREIITGGRNIGDEYFDLREDFNFLDREMHIEGEIVKKIKDSFEVFWNSKASESVDRPKMPEENDFKYRNHGNGKGAGSNYGQYRSDLSFWKKSVLTAQEFLYKMDDVKEEEAKIRSLGKELLKEEYTATCKDMVFASEFPITNKSNRQLRILKNHLYERIANAKEKVRFDSPYFIVDKESKEALDHALERNIKIDLLTNGLNSTDAIYVFDVFKTIVKNWINKGLLAFTFKGEKPAYYQVYDEKIEKARFGVHAKTFVIDDEDTIIGTYNFDPRSANYNAEMIVSCEDNREVASAVNQDIERRMDDAFMLDSSEKVDETAFYKTGFLKRIAYGLLKIPANIFSYLL